MLVYEKTNFKHLFYLRILIALIVFASLNLIALILPYNSLLNTGFSETTRIGIFIFSFSIFAQSIILSTAAFFQKKINYFSYAVGLVIGSIVNLVLVLIFAFLNYSIFLILFAFIASGFTSALLLLKLSKENILPPAIDKKFAKIEHWEFF